MAKTNDAYGWRFPLFLREEGTSTNLLPGEVSGGASRMRAVQVEYERFRSENRNQKWLVLVTGGEERGGGSRSDEAAKQLVIRYGLPQSAIVSIRGHGSTIGNAAAAANYLRLNSSLAQRIRHIEIVTNDYHMLRAWIIFSRDMFLSTVGHQPMVSQTAIVSISNILQSGLPHDDLWIPSQIGRDRQRIIELLRPSFGMSSINVVPLVVEDVLESARCACGAPRRYASRLRESIWVRRTLPSEYKRIVELLGELCAVTKQERS